MGIFRNRGPRELNEFGPGDALIAAAHNIFGPDSREGTVLHWLQEAGDGAQGLFSSNATTKQKAALVLLTERLIVDFKSHARSGLNAESQRLIATKIHVLASEVISGSANRITRHPLEFPLSVATASAAIRMAELKRQHQANLVLKDGMLQVAALILAFGFIVRD